MVQYRLCPILLKPNIEYLKYSEVFWLFLAQGMMGMDGLMPSVSNFAQAKYIIPQVFRGILAIFGSRYDGDGWFNTVGAQFRSSHIRNT